LYTLRVVEEEVMLNCWSLLLVGCYLSSSFPDR
jgi:hypothetical protein